MTKSFALLFQMKRTKALPMETPLFIYGQLLIVSELISQLSEMPLLINGILSPKKYWETPTKPNQSTTI